MSASAEVVERMGPELELELELLLPVLDERSRRLVLDERSRRLVLGAVAGRRGRAGPARWPG